MNLKYQMLINTIIKFEKGTWRQMMVAKVNLVGDDLFEVMTAEPTMIW